MICSQSKYNEKGELIHRITAGEKTFPEVLEVEYCEYGFKQQSLYDLIRNEDGKEFKKLKLRTEIIYNEEGKATRVTAPDSIALFDYEPREVEIPVLGEKFETTSITKTENLLKNEDGSDKDDTVCYVGKISGSFNKDLLTIKYDSARVLETYRKGSDELKCTEYMLFDEHKNMVYYELRRRGEIPVVQTLEYNENNKLTYVCLVNYDTMQTTIGKFEYDVLDNVTFNYGTIDPDVVMNIYNSSKRVIDMNTEDEILVEESVYEFEDNGTDDKRIRNVITQYDAENNDSTQYTGVEYVFDDEGRMTKLINNFEHTTSIMTYPYSEDESVARMIVKHTEPKKITQFTRDKSNARNEDIHLYLYSEFENKDVVTEYTKFPSGYITKKVTVTEEGNEICSILTNNGEDATVGVVFDSLY